MYTLLLYIYCKKQLGGGVKIFTKHFSPQNIVINKQHCSPTAL